jgi:polyisoprenoid-binding protein YceI
MAVFEVRTDSQVWTRASSSLHAISGEASGLEGVVEADVVGGVVEPGSLNARIELRVDKLRSGNPLFDSALKRVVQAGRYPKIVGETREMVLLEGDGLYQVIGDVTFHGVTRTIDGRVTVEVQDDRTLVIEGEHVFDVEEFGVKPPRIAMIRVHPDVQVRIRVVAERRE